VRWLSGNGRERQAARLQRLRAAGALPKDPDLRTRVMLTLEREDLLGPRELDLAKCPPWLELQAMVRCVMMMMMMMMMMVVVMMMMMRRRRRRMRIRVMMM
jgi:hypothetical protein